MLRASPVITDEKMRNPPTELSGPAMKTSAGGGLAEVKYGSLNTAASLVATLADGRVGFR